MLRVTFLLLALVGCDDTRYASSGAVNPGANNGAAPDADSRVVFPDQRFVPDATALLGLSLDRDGHPVVAYIAPDGSAHISGLREDQGWSADLPSEVTAEDTAIAHTFDFVSGPAGTTYLCTVGNRQVTQWTLDERDGAQPRQRAIVTTPARGCRVAVEPGGTPWFAWTEQDEFGTRMFVDNVEDQTYRTFDGTSPMGFAYLPMPFDLIADEDGPAFVYRSEDAAWAGRLGEEPVVTVQRSGAGGVHPIQSELVRNGDAWVLVHRWFRGDPPYHDTSILRRQPGGQEGVGASHFLVEQGPEHTAWGVATTGAPVLLGYSDGAITFHISPHIRESPPPQEQFAAVAQLGAIEAIVTPEDRLHVVYLDPAAQRLVWLYADLRDFGL